MSNNCKIWNISVNQVKRSRKGIMMPSKVRQTLNDSEIMPMKKLVFLFLVTALLLVFSLTGAADFRGLCVGVSDGDTISVIHNGATTKIRLSGIDCTEKKQSYGVEAKSFTSAALLNKDVFIKEKGKDRYGRLLAEVFIDGRCLNHELTAVGLAWHYKRFSDSKDLADAERHARVFRKGLWAQDNPEAPWEFRKR